MRHFPKNRSCSERKHPRNGLLRYIIKCRLKFWSIMFSISVPGSLFLGNVAWEGIEPMRLGFSVTEMFLKGEKRINCDRAQKSSTRSTKALGFLLSIRACWVTQRRSRLIYPWRAFYDIPLSCYSSYSVLRGTRARFVVRKMPHWVTPRH